MNVLEVMDEAAKFLRDGDYGDEADDIMKARAAVAELIEALKELRNECTRSVEYSDWPELQELVDRADTALAKASP